MKDCLINISKILVSKKSSVKMVEPLIFSLKEKIHIDDQSFYNLLIAVTEGINNAIIHGNKCDSSKKVYLNVKANEKEISITIEDEGGGFEPEKLADPRAPENLMKEHGRGVFLMKELADSINFSFTEKGATINLKFFLKAKAV